MFIIFTIAHARTRSTRYARSRARARSLSLSLSLSLVCVCRVCVCDGVHVRCVCQCVCHDARATDHVWWRGGFKAGRMPRPNVVPLIVAHHSGHANIPVAAAHCLTHTRG